jgi:hypothetical protein
MALKFFKMGNEDLNCRQLHIPQYKSLGVLCLSAVGKGQVIFLDNAPSNAEVTQM